MKSLNLVVLTGALAPLSRALAAECYDAEVIAAADYAWNATSWFAIDDAGSLYGNYCAQESACEDYDATIGGAIWNAGTGGVETFAAPDGYNVVQMVGASGSGRIVGCAVVGDGAGGVGGAVAFEVSGGVATVMDDPTGSGYYAASDVNDEGTIVGYSKDPADPDDANRRIGWVKAASGTVTTIELDFAVRTVPFGINDAGDVVGYFLHDDGYVGGFVRSAEGDIETLTAVVKPPYFEYWVYDIDSAGTIVGQYVEYDETFTAVGGGALYREDGAEIDYLNVLGYTDTIFTGINASGVVSGTANGQSTGLRITPHDLLDWYTDADGDTFGDPATLSSACEDPGGAVTDGTDCNDADSSVHPAATETCDGVDQDCDGSVDEDGVCDTGNPPEDTGNPPADDTAADEKDAGCGCGTTRPANGITGLLLAALALARGSRRRS